MADDIQAVGLMLVLFLTGGILTFNLLDLFFGINMGLGFDSIKGFTSGIWIIILKGVGLALMGLSVYVIANIIRR